MVHLIVILLHVLQFNYLDQILNNYFVYAEIRFEQDAMTVYDGREFYTAVGSEWKLNFKGDVVLTDNYLLRHAALTAEGIGLEKQGNKYVFTSDGDGSVHIVIGGYVCKTESVHVREKQEIKRTMLRTAFENGIVSRIVGHIFDASQEFYDWVVIDTNSGFSQTSTAILKDADIVAVTLRQNRSLLDGLFKNETFCELDNNRIFHP